MSAGDGAASSVRAFVLEKESELRVEVGSEASLGLRLASGNAEVFGAELPQEKWITVQPSQNIAIFTWKEATIELEGVSEVEYVADETPMVSYVNVHAILDGRRSRAMTNKGLDSSQGPRAIVVGPTDSGKSSLCKMLLNWACRRSWKPTFVDLDISQGSITIPGCIAASPVQTPIDAFGGIPTEMPVAYFFGHTSASVNVELYKDLLTELALTLERRFSCDVEYEAAGMVINTMGWVDGLGYELLLQAISTFNANVVLVLGQEKLFSMLRDVLKTKPHIDIVKLHKSGGVVPRNQKTRQSSCSCRIKEYFYGLNNDLSPNSLSMTLDDISVYRMAGDPPAPRSFVSVDINREIIHSVLAISYAKVPDQIISSNVAGFVCVMEIDMESRRITFLAPCPGELPSKVFVMGTMKWSES